MARFLLSTIMLLGPSLALGNSCCGQTPASFSILSMQQSLSLTTTYSFIETKGRVFDDSEAFFIWDDKNRTIQSLAFNVASAFAERQQFFINASLMNAHYQDALENGSSTQWSDTLMGYSYEVLPEYEFSYWKPIIYTSFLLSLPTGHSIYDPASLSEGSDVTGHNQWGTGVGVTLRKVYFPWTVTLQARSLYFFAKNFQASQQVRVSAFYDSSVALLLNHSSPFWGLQFHGGLTWVHLSQRKVSPSQVTSGVSQSFNSMVGVQKAISEQWAAGLTLADQRLIGPARNTLIKNTISLNFNYSLL